MKKSRKKIILIIVVSFLGALAVLCFLGVFLYVNYFGGGISIRSWMRPSPKMVTPVENYHSYLDFDEPANSMLPRIDITMDQDYLLSKADYTKCLFQITNAAEYNLEEKEAKIRIRGNSTAYADKKPYKIKFLEKTSLFGGGEEKSWVLLANVNDITGIHNYVSMELYKHIAAENTFVPMVKFVNLYINDEYQGVYNLCDQVETGKTRVPISDKLGETPAKTDYLLENDMYANTNETISAEDIGWFWMDKSFVPVEIKSPDTEDKAYSKEYTDYIKARMDEIYDVIISKDWNAIQEAVDVNSFINGILVSIIADNEDIAYKSLYYYIPAGGKLTYGPVWDMDLTFGARTGYYTEGFKEYSNYNIIWHQLMNVPEFREAFVNRYKELYPNLEQMICKDINEAVSIAGSDLENEFANRAQWGRVGTEEYKSAKTYEESIDFMKSWTHTRVEYLYELYCR